MRDRLNFLERSAVIMVSLFGRNPQSVKACMGAYKVTGWKIYSSLPVHTPRMENMQAAQTSFKYFYMFLPLNQKRGK